MRSYFIHQTLCRESGARFPFPPLTKRWVFTKNNQFILVPSLSIAPNLEKSADFASDSFSPSIDPENVAFRRLSLNLSTFDPLMPDLTDFTQSTDSTTLIGEGISKNMESKAHSSRRFPSVDEQGKWKNLGDFKSKTDNPGTDDDRYSDLRPLLSLERADSNKSTMTAFRVAHEDPTATAEVSSSDQHDAEASSVYSQDGERNTLPASNSRALTIRLSSKDELLKLPDESTFTLHETGTAAKSEKCSAQIAFTTPQQSSNAADTTLGSPSSPDAPVASPLATKSSLPTGRGKSSGHARTRHEPLSGPNSPALDMSILRNYDIAAVDDSLRVAPLRLKDRKMKRRSSISEGQIAQLRAQLRGEIKPPPDDSIYPLDPQSPTVPRFGAQTDFQSLNIMHTPSPSIVSSSFHKGNLLSDFPGFERRFTPIQEAPAKEPSPRKNTSYGASDLAFPRLDSSWSSEMLSESKTSSRLAYDLPSPAQFAQRAPENPFATVTGASAFNLDKERPLLPRLSGSSRAHLATKEPSFGVAPPQSPNPSGKAKHLPIVVKGYEYPTRENHPKLTFDPAAEMNQLARDAVPAPAASTTAATAGHKSSKSEGIRSTSNAVAEFFSWRKRKVNPTVKDPRPPSLAWNPFERLAPEPPSASAWVHGEDEDEDEKEQRATFFRAQASGQASPAKKTAERGAYAVGTLPRDRAQGRPRVTAETFAPGLQHKFSKENVAVRAAESAVPPVPPLPQRTPPGWPANALEARRRAQGGAGAVASDGSLRSTFVRAKKASQK